MKRKPPNYLPGKDDYDHEPLLAALKAAREELVKYRAECGNRVPARLMTDTTVDYIDALTKLFGYPGATNIVHPVDLPSTNQDKR